MFYPMFHHVLPCFHGVHNHHVVPSDAVAGWIQEMTADGDTTRRLCDDLAKQMGELISQATWQRMATATATTDGTMMGPGRVA